MQRGFSVLEILIAMTLVLSAIVTVSLALSGTKDFLIGGQANAEALHIAEGVLENEQALARKDFRLVVATSSDQVSSPITYHVAVTVATTTISGSSVQDYFAKRVTARVSWAGQYGKNLNVSLSAIVTNFQAAVGGDTCDPEPWGNWKTPTVTSASLASIVGDANPNGPYSVTDLDAYQRRLYVAVATSTAGTPWGPKVPGTVADASGSGGSLVWSSPSQAITKDGIGATLATSGFGISHYLKATNFGFSIPPGATILGIKVDVYRSANGQTGSNAVLDSQVKIIRADGTVGALNKAGASTWPTPITDAQYGSSSDFWGESNWTPAAINNSNFGVALAVAGNASGANRTASVDSVQVTIYYTKAFYIVNAANPASLTLLGGLATSTIPYSINAITIATSSAISTAYAATNSPTGSNQLEVINIKDPAAPYVVSTTVTGMAAHGVGNSIFYKDGYVYLGLTSSGGTPEFNVIDVVTNPTQPQLRGSYTIGAAVNAIYVKDGYAYLTTNDTTRELVVLNVTNPAAPTLVMSHNALADNGPTFGYGRAFYKVGDTDYLGRSWVGNVGGAPEFSVLNDTGTTIAVATSTDVGPNTSNPFSLNGIVVRDYLEYLLLGSATNGGKLVIQNATSSAQWTISIPNLVAGSGNGVGGIALDCEGNTLYVASTDATNRGFVATIIDH